MIPGAVVELAGRGLAARDQFLDGCRSVACPYRPQRGVLCGERDRREVLERIVREVRVGDRIDHHGHVHRREQGVAVGRQLGDAVAAIAVWRRAGFRSPPAAPDLGEAWATIRATMSVGPPAGKGTTMRTGRLGSVGPARA